jgi:hypothetical protein
MRIVLAAAKNDAATILKHLPTLKGRAHDAAPAALPLTARASADCM